MTFSSLSLVLSERVENWRGFLRDLVDDVRDVELWRVRGVKLVNESALVHGLRPSSVSLLFQSAHEISFGLVGNTRDRLWTPRGGAPTTQFAQSSERVLSLDVARVSLRHPL